MISVDAMLSSRFVFVPRVMTGREELVRPLCVVITTDTHDWGVVILDRFRQIWVNSFQINLQC